MPQPMPIQRQCCKHIPWYLPNRVFLGASSAILFFLVVRYFKEALGIKTYIVEEDTTGSIRFIGYKPSVWEEDWRINIHEYQRNPCEPLMKASTANLSETFLSLVDVFKSDHFREPSKLPDSILSHFVYMVQQQEVHVVIEPLVGYFRHPYAIPQCLPKGKSRVDVLDLSYIIFRGMALETFNMMYPGRKYLFDLGINGPARSLKWFDDIYRENGIVFDQVWGWDSRNFNPEEFWGHVPIPLYSKLHLINVPVTQNVSDERHPFSIIKNIYEQGDYIALKLDIDTPGYEQQLADHLLLDTELSSMIGDFFYEKHMGAVHFPHHSLPSDHPVHNMKAVMDFFSALRQKGIRAHYWV